MTSAILRVTTSLKPPEGYGWMIRISFVGYSAACAGNLEVLPAQYGNVPERLPSFISLSLLVEVMNSHRMNLFGIVFQK